MRRNSRFGVALLLALTLLAAGGCVDGVRQTIAPYLFSGLVTIADGVIVQNTEDNSTVSTGAQSIVNGLLAGAQRAVYPKG